MGIASVVLALVVVAGEPAPPADPTQQDLERLQGDWAVVSMIHDGEQVPADDAQALFRTVKGNEFTMFQYDKPLQKGTFKIDARQSPKVIDEQSARGRGKPRLGIYEFAGDQLRVCMAAPGGKRPNEFKSAPGAKMLLVVWERQKK